MNLMKPLVASIVLTLAISCQLQAQTPELTEQLDRYILPYVETQNFAGQVMITRKGQVIFDRAYGFANLEFGIPHDRETVLQIASLSKPFTAAAILLLEQRGLLTTTDPVNKFISGFPSGDVITLHHLLAHTSGLTEINDLPEYENASVWQQTPETLALLFMDKPLRFQPGAKYEYCNSNYIVLAWIVELVSHQKYGDFLKEHIFIPAGMKSTLHHGDMSTVIPHAAEGYAPDGNFGLKHAPYLDWSSKSGNGSIASTASDLEKWNRALNGTSILSAKSKEKMFTKYFEAGYGWYMKEQFARPYVYMNGRSPGFSAHIGRYVNEDVCVIVLSNLYVSVPRQIALDLAAIVFKEPVHIPKWRKGKLTSAELNALVGVYQFGSDFYRPDYKMEVTQRDGNLFSSWGELIPFEGGEFIQRTYWSRVTFERDTTGRVSAMILDGYRGVRVQK